MAEKKLIAMSSRAGEFNVKGRKRQNPKGPAGHSAKQDERRAWVKRLEKELEIKHQPKKP